MARKPRPKKRFMFWLLKDDDEQQPLIDYISYLKRTRKFAETVRNGLRLMWDLSDDNTTVLFQLFPAMRSQLAPKSDNSDLIEQFRQMLMQHGAVTTTGSTIQGAKEIQTPTFSGDDDDDIVLIKKDPNAGKNMATNFLDSVLGLQD